MSTFLITFKPVASYFFGGEQTFGEGEEANYFAKSNPFPQQTTILGTLRKEVLIRDGVYKENFNEYTDIDVEKINGLIGEQSFRVGEPVDFKVIKSLSPIFLVQNNKSFYISAPKDRNLIYSPEPGRAFVNNKKDTIPFFSNYNSKNGCDSGFVSNKGEDKSFKDIFTEHIKIGITKERDGDDKESFFKQSYYNLQSDFAFGLIIEIEFELDNNTIYMGANNSSFFMKVNKFDGNLNNQFSDLHEDNKIILLSDAYVKNTIYDFCNFALTDTITFRNIRLSSKKYRFERKSKSSKHTFISRGSVFYPSDKSKVIEMLDSDKSLKKIGYNYYL